MDKKIMLLIPTLGWGGAEKQALLFANYLKENNIEVLIGTFAKEGIVKKKCEEQEIACHIICSNMDLISILILCYVKICRVLLKKNKYILRQIYDLYRKVKKEKVTHIVSYCADPGTLAGNLKKIDTKLKIAWYQRDAGIYNSIPEYQKYAINHVDYVFANSISGKKWIESNYARKAEIIYNGTALMEAVLDKREWLQKLGKKEESIIVTMVANLSSAKDHMTLLKAWEIVVKKVQDKDILLVLAGRFDEKYASLKEYVERKELQKYIFFLGQEEDIRGLLNVTTLFTFSAISEGTSNALVEASLCGLCTVATDLPEIRAVLSEENKKFLFEKGNYYEYADKILEAISDDIKREKIGWNNKAKAEQLFESEKNFSKILQMMNI